MRDNNSGRRDFKGRGGFAGGRNSDRPQMHQAICSDCGNACEVPFKPSGSKPVFCKNCFASNRPDDSRGGGRHDFGSRDGRPSFGEKRMYQAVCDQCNKACEVPFRPTGEKPVFCDACFGKGDASHGASRNIGGGNKQFQVQFDEINAKLDKILKKLAHTVTRDGINRDTIKNEDDLDLVASNEIEAEPLLEKKVEKNTSKKKTTKKSGKKIAAKK